MASISSTAINPLPNSSAISFSSRGPLRPTDPIVRAITPTATASEDRSIVSAGFSIKGANAPLTSSVSRNSGVAIASSSSGSISSSSSGGNGNGLAIGLGVGLSLGIILLAAVVYIFVSRKRTKKSFERRSKALGLNEIVKLGDLSGRKPPKRRSSDPAPLGSI